jgi:hypothetical protein
MPVVNAITEFESDCSRSTKGHFRTSTANGFFLFHQFFLLSDTSGFHVSLLLRRMILGVLVLTGNTWTTTFNGWCLPPSTDGERFPCLCP